MKRRADAGRDLDVPGRDERTRETDGRADPGQSKSLSQQQADDRRWLRAHGESNADLGRSLTRDVGHDSVETGRFSPGLIPRGPAG